MVFTLIYMVPLSWDSLLLLFSLLIIRMLMVPVPHICAYIHPYNQTSKNSCIHLYIHMKIHTQTYIHTKPTIHTCTVLSLARVLMIPVLVAFFYSSYGKLYFIYVGVCVCVQSYGKLYFICMCVCKQMSERACSCWLFLVCSLLHVCVNVCMSVYVSWLLLVFIYLRIHTYIYAYMHIWLCMYMYTLTYITYTHTNVHIYITYPKRIQTYICIHAASRNVTCFLIFALASLTDFLDGLVHTYIHTYMLCVCMHVGKFARVIIAIKQIAFKLSHLSKNENQKTTGNL